MLFTRLGDSDLEASRIGFGCWAIGGADWGPVDDNDSISAIAKALDCGINFFEGETILLNLCKCYTKFIHQMHPGNRNFKGQLWMVMNAMEN